jgi:hypothetical protein
MVDWALANNDHPRNLGSTRPECIFDALVALIWLSTAAIQSTVAKRSKALSTSQNDFMHRCRYCVVAVIVDCKIMAE